MSDTSDDFSDSYAGDMKSAGKDDDEFDYDYSGGGGGERAGQKSTVVQNQHYDEAVDLGSSGSLDDSIDTEAGGGSPRMQSLGSGAPPRRGDSPPNAAEESAGRGEYDDHVEIPGHNTQPPARNQQPQQLAPQQQAPNITRRSVSSDSSSDDEDEEDSEAQHEAIKAGGYNPAEYAHLEVSEEIRELFGYIGRYKPHNIELETKLKCFIPDFIPAVGEIDAFIKVPRPDGKEDGLGLKVLDEPAAIQSDPTVWELIYIAIAKESNLEPASVRSIENADKNSKEIMRWINNINELHRKKPPPQVHYSKSMPDIDDLMQIWPEKFEELLKDITLPSAEMNLSIKEYAAVICAILDIPVYNSIVESLHVLFTLYSVFKSNQHLNAAGGATGAGAGAGAMVPGQPGMGQPGMGQPGMGGSGGQSMML